MIRRIEVDFAVPVKVTSDQTRRIAEVVSEIARENTPEGHVHWLASHGSKTKWSRTDAAFLGLSVDSEAPLSGEPTFEDDVFSFETFCRERYQGEEIKKGRSR